MQRFPLVGKEVIVFLLIFSWEKSNGGVMRAAFWGFVVSVHPPTRPWENAVNVIIPVQQRLFKCHQSRRTLDFLKRIRLQENILFYWSAEVVMSWGVFNSAASILSMTQASVTVCRLSLLSGLCSPAGEASCAFARSLFRPETRWVCGCHRQPVLPPEHRHHGNRQHDSAWRQRAGPS